MPMRSMAAYLVTGIFVVLAMDFVAPPVGLGLAAGIWPKGDQGAVVQTVDRLHKGDRLPIPSTSVVRQPAPQQSPEVLVGCEPVFSSLSASAKANFAGPNRTDPNLPGLCVV
jgi:hypothetical protein